MRVKTDNHGRPIPSPFFVPPTGEFVGLKRHNSVLKKRTIVTETITEEYEVQHHQRDLSSVSHVVYFVKCNEYTKIGYTNNIEERMTVLQVGNPYELEIVDLIECDTQAQAQQLEKELHTRYQSSHVRGEWYKL